MYGPRSTFYPTITFPFLALNTLLITLLSDSPRFFLTSVRDEISLLPNVSEQKRTPVNSVLLIDIQAYSELKGRESNTKENCSIEYACVCCLHVTLPLTRKSRFS
jgi:hypothetical protein